MAIQYTVELKYDGYYDLQGHCNLCKNLNIPFEVKEDQKVVIAHPQTQQQYLLLK